MKFNFDPFEISRMAKRIYYEEKSIFDLLSCIDESAGKAIDRFNLPSDSIPIEDIVEWINSRRFLPLLLCFVKRQELIRSGFDGVKKSLIAKFECRLGRKLSRLERIALQLARLSIRRELRKAKIRFLSFSEFAFLYLGIDKNTKTEDIINAYKEYLIRFTSGDFDD